MRHEPTFTPTSLSSPIPRRYLAAFLLTLLAGCSVGEDDGGPKSGNLRLSRSLLGLNAPADGVGSDVVDDLGASWVRLELVDPTPGVELSAEGRERLDTVLADYRRRNANVLLILDYASLADYEGFGNGVACGDWAAWRATWLARVGRVAEDFGSRIDAWEVWNEPDHPMAGCNSGDYNPGMPAGEFGRLLRDTYAVIRDAGARGAVVAGGLDSGQVQYIVDAGEATGGLVADGVAIHPYGVVPDARWCPNPGEDLVCEWGTLGGKVDQYFAAVGRPIWITEFGLKTEDSQHQANYLTAAYGAFASRGERVATAFLFAASDAMVAPFGLTYANWSPKPGAYDAYRALTGSSTEEPPSPRPTPADGFTSNLHGTVYAGSKQLEGITVTAWGHTNGDLHETTTDALGIYQFTDLAPQSLYNIVVNARFDPQAVGGYAVIDAAHGYAVRDNIALEAGPDDWHGEDFPLSR